MKHGVQWIFGYGSLIWRPSFAFVERRASFVTGWARRFWQGSTDHRGVPGAPGRVVTLIPQSDACTWGVAYAVERGRLNGILPALDHREKGGYERHDLPLYGNEAELISERGLVYVATAQNQNYLGPAPLAEIARQVKSSRGPSGTNLEYVLSLANALRALGVADDHVSKLVALLEDD